MSRLQSDDEKRLQNQVKVHVVLLNFGIRRMSITIQKITLSLFIGKVVAVSRWIFDILHRPCAYLAPPFCPGECIPGLLWCSGDPKLCLVAREGPIPCRKTLKGRVGSPRGASAGSIPENCHLKIIILKCRKAAIGGGISVI